jgi:putative ABC transport system permease protein
MRLAWHNLIHDRLRFLVTVAGIAFAVFLMIFQSSLFTGFLQAASLGVDASDAEIWIVSRGTNSFEFPGPLPERFHDLALGVPGVAAVQRIVVGFAYWQQASGRLQAVLLIGAEPGVGRRFPIPHSQAGIAVIAPEAVLPEAVLVDRSNLAPLEFTPATREVEIGQRRATSISIIDNFASFFGTPFVFTAYSEAVKYLHMDQHTTSFLTVHLTPGSQVAEVKDKLQAHLPEADVWTRQEFARRAQRFWVIKTGAGGALLTGAFLGFLVGLAIVSQNIYATTLENLEEYATLKALGASRGYVQRVVIAQALISGVVGSLIGLAAIFPAVKLVKTQIAWVYTPWWLPLAIIVVSALMCGLASVVSVRKALSVEPGRVFRA